MWKYRILSNLLYDRRLWHFFGDFLEFFFPFLMIFFFQNREFCNRISDYENVFLKMAKIFPQKTHRLWHWQSWTQGDLAMFGYRPPMKVEIYWNPFISCLLAWTMCRRRNMAILLEIFFSQCLFGKYFFKKEQELDSTNFANLWISKRISIYLFIYLFIYF